MTKNVETWDKDHQIDIGLCPKWPRVVANKTIAPPAPLQPDWTEVNAPLQPDWTKVKCPIEIFCGDSLPPKKTLETFPYL